MEKWAMFVDFVLIAGMSLLFLLVVFLLKSNTGFPKKLLSVFFINSIFFLLYYYAYLHKSQIVGGIAILFGSGAGFLLGPFLLFYIRSLIWPRQKVLSSLKLHLVPFAIYWLLVSLPVALSLGTGLLRSYHEQYVVIADYVNLLENIYFFSYTLMALHLVRRIKKAQEEVYASIDAQNIEWITYLTIGLMIIIVLDSAFSVYELLYPMIPWNVGTIIAFALIFLYCYLGYKGMFQAKILLPSFLLAEPAAQKTQAESTTEDSHSKPVRQLDIFTPKEIAALEQRLYHILETEKPYLNDALSLSELAAELDITDKKLSELLNQHLNTNFYNLINEYRVQAVKEKLQTDESGKFTLLSIAYDCGFQSKASFNRVFKQKTGMSPSKYRQLKISS